MMFLSFNRRDCTHHSTQGLGLRFVQWRPRHAIPRLTSRSLLTLLLLMGGMPLQPWRRHPGQSSGQVLEMMGVAAAVTWSWKPWCNFRECCERPWINPNNITSGLDEVLTKELFGQHIVHETVIAALSSHLSSPNPPKPLVLSFHGRTGTGKNFVSRLIAESIYREGMASRYVHLKIADRDYRHRSMLAEYKEALLNEVLNSVKKCPNQLFIFDEVENMPPGLLDAIRPYLDYTAELEGVKFNKAIFIFLSNTAAREISSHVLEHLQSGKKRESIYLNHLEPTIENSAFKLDGSGFEKARLIDKYLISHFIPFLPLETAHVRSCVRAELRGHSVHPRIDVDDLEEAVVRELQFWPKGVEMFATKGCKGVVEKLNLALYRAHKNAKRTLLDNGRSQDEL